MQALAEFAHPACLAGGVANDKGVVGDGFGDDGTGTDEGKPSDIVSANDGGVGSDGGSMLYQGSGIFALAVDGRSWVDHIGEDHRRSKENIVFTDHTGVDTDVVLHFNIFAKYHLWTHNNVLADVAVFTYDAVGHDVAEVPYFCSVAYLAIFVDDGGGVGEEFVFHGVGIIIGVGFGVGFGLVFL